MRDMKIHLQKFRLPEIARLTECSLDFYSNLPKHCSDNNNFSVTPEEIKHWYEGFMKDCPTGKLTRAEFSKIYNQFFPTGDPSAFAQYVEFTEI